MNKYKFSEISINDSEHFTTVINKKMINEFCNISGDINPLHLNDSFAKKYGFKRKIVYGLLTSAFYSKLIGVHLPGLYSVIDSIEIQFVKPVYDGDKLTIMGVVLNKDSRFKFVNIESKIKNQDDEIVSKAKIRVHVKE